MAVALRVDCLSSINSIKRFIKEVEKQLLNDLEMKLKEEEGSAHLPNNTYDLKFEKEGLSMHSNQ